MTPQTNNIVVKEKKETVDVGFFFFLMCKSEVCGLIQRWDVDMNKETKNNLKPQENK